MARLPIPGSDSGTWGDVLNTFLLTSHNGDGTLNDNAVTGAAIATGAVGTTEIATGAVTAPKLSATGGTTGLVLVNDQTVQGGMKWDVLTSGSSAPSGPAGGDLGGTYPNPVIAAGAVGTAKIVDTAVTEAKLSSAVQTKLNDPGAVTSVAGKTGVVTLVKGDVGLGNVDNTSDATKNTAVATLTNKDLTAGTNTFPTLNQNTTGKSGSTDALKSATTTINVSSATAPSAGQVLTANDSTHATWQTPSGSGSVVWGGISGTLASQTDLQSALNAKADQAITITGGTSLAGGGSLAANRTLTLLNDSASPGNSKYYGTNGSGTKGYFSLPAGGGSSFTAVNRTGGQGDYVASNYDFVVCNASSAGFNVTLPAAASGAWVRVKKTDSSGNAISVLPPSGTIDNLGSVSINTQWQSQDFMSDGTTWYRT